jgi:hypothetical protein
MTVPTNDQTISEVTRRRVLDLLSDKWAGRLDEVEFLSRLYDLEAMQSFDGRFAAASGDIWKHRIMNDDWDIDWVFNDSRFNIFRGTDEAFLRFIAETVHPIVRPDTDEAAELVDALNAELEVDGWRLVEMKRLSGRPVYGPERLGERASIVEEPTGWPKVDRQIQQARVTLRQADSEEQYQSVGLLCREVLISVAQATYVRERYPPLDGVEPSEADASRMIEAIIAVELSGSANEEARAHAKAALKLALALQHKRTADVRTAALCSEATFSVVNILAILTGRRER